MTKDGQIMGYYYFGTIRRSFEDCFGGLNPPKTPSISLFGPHVDEFESSTEHKPHHHRHDREKMADHVVEALQPSFEPPKIALK